KAIYSSGLPAYDPQQPHVSHMVAGPNGAYSVHNIGLPALIAIPYQLFGIVGVKAWLVLLSSLAVLVAWHISGVFLSHPAQRALTVSAVTLGLPLVPAAGQIFPDVIGGIACLHTLYWMLTAKKRRRAVTLFGYSVLLALVPWLQIRFAAPVALL